MSGATPAQTHVAQPSSEGWSRLLFVLPSLSAGGSERVVTTLANHWAAQGREIGIVTFEPATIAPYYPLDQRVSLTRLDLPPVSRPKWRAIMHTGRRILALRRSFRSYQPEAVISFLTKTNVMSVAAAAGLGVPVIISERNNPALQPIDPLWAWAQRRAYPRAYAFVTMTRRAAELYPEQQRPRTVIIANPINLSVNRNPAGRDGYVLVAVGRLVDQKRFDRLIDAFSIIAAEHPDWRLVIWGEGEKRAELEAQRDRLGLADRVLLPGLTKRPGAWAETADIFALSSEYEGWANVVAEAMCAGLPVVAFDCPFGPREIMVDRVSGMLVPNGDVRALAAALSEVMGDPALRESLGRNAAIEARKYAPEAIAAQWEALIDQAVGDSRRAREPSRTPA